MSKELIERLEDLSGADRRFDGDIFKASYPDRDWHEFEDGWCARDPVDTCAFDVAPAYTASVDAALTLVPQGWDYCIYGGDRWDQIECQLFEEGKHISALGSTLALAIVIAALRARIDQ